MSALTVTAPVADADLDTGDRVTFAGVTASEWIKFRTLRSSWYTLAAGLISLLAIGLAIGYNTGRNFSGLAAEDAAVSATSQGYVLAELLIGVLGVLFVSGEYSTGLIRSTVAAVPSRAPVVLAKSLVFGAVVLVSTLLTSFVSFLSSQAILSNYHHGHSLTEPSALRVVIGVAVYLTLIGLLGSAFGWILRSTPGGISALLCLILVLPLLFGQLLGSWGKTISEYLPSNAGESFLTSIRADHSLAPWPGLAVLAVWVVVALVIAAVRLRRRDA